MVIGRDSIILSTIAQIFDPMSTIGPNMLNAILVLHSLCSLKIGWDESVSQDVHCGWINYFVKELSYIPMGATNSKNFKFERNIGPRTA